MKYILLTEKEMAFLMWLYFYGYLEGFRRFEKQATKGYEVMFFDM